jgi:hypothetical protein
LREGGSNHQTSGRKVIQVKGANNNITHSLNDDERSEFTAHINSVLAGDLHIGDRIPIPTHTMQIFDECRGNVTFYLFSCLSIAKYFSVFLAKKGDKPFLRSAAWNIFQGNSRQ